MSLKRILKDLLNENCSALKSISDITKQYDYFDDFPNGKADANLVSCGQTNSYNELKHIYDKKLKKHVDEKSFTEEQALQALCQVCKELKNPRKRENFYNSLEQKLGITI